MSNNKEHNLCFHCKCVCQKLLKKLKLCKVYTFSKIVSKTQNFAAKPFNKKWNKNHMNNFTQVIKNVLSSSYHFLLSSSFSAVVTSRLVWYKKSVLQNKEIGYGQIKHLILPPKHFIKKQDFFFVEIHIWYIKLCNYTVNGRATTEKWAECGKTSKTKWTRKWWKHKQNVFISLEIQHAAFILLNSATAEKVNGSAHFSLHEIRHTIILW